MCHVMYAYTTGDACGMNMITRNSYALNQGFVLERAPVKPARAMLEGNMGGDKKPSARYFERGGHGKTVMAEATLTEEAVRRVLKTSLEDLAELAFVGTHGAIASGMQSVAFTPATAIAALFTATGQDIGMVGTSSMAHGTAHRVDGGLHVSMRLASLEVATVGGGTTLPYAAPGFVSWAVTGRARSTASRRSWPRRPSRSRSLPRRRWPPPDPRISTARISSAVACAEAAWPRPSRLTTTRRAGVAATTRVVCTCHSRPRRAWSATTRS